MQRGKNLPFYNNVPIVHETYRMAKINFINSGAVDIIRTAYYIYRLELIKLIFAVLYVT